MTKIPYKCPVCDGQGVVSKPPDIAGDVRTWTATDTTHTCHACKGEGVIWSEEDDDIQQI